RCAVEPDCCEHNQHDASVSKCVDVKRVNQMVDVKNVATKVENFQNEREQRDAAKHHVRQVAKERGDKESHLCAMLTHLLFGSRSAGGRSPFFKSASSSARSFGPSFPGWKRRPFAP